MTRSGERRATVLVASAALTGALNVAFHVTMSRALGGVGYGRLAGLLAVLLVAMVPVIAVQASVARSAAAAPDAAPGALLAAVAQASAVVVVVGALFAPLVQVVLRLVDPWPAVLGSAWLGCALVGAAARGVLLGHGHHHRVAIASVVGTVARVMIALPLAPVVGTVGAMAATLLGEAVSTVLSLWPLRPLLRAPGGRPLRSSGADTGLALVSQASLWLLAGLPALLARHVGGRSGDDLAVLAAVASSTAMLSMTLGMALLPRFTVDTGRRVVQRGLLGATAIGGLALVGLGAAPRTLLGLFAGRDVAIDRPMVVLVGAAAAAIGLTAVSSAALVARRRPECGLAALGALTGVAAGLVFGGSAYGAAMAALAGATVAAVLTTAAALRCEPARSEGTEGEHLLLTAAELELTMVVPTYRGGDALVPAVRGILDALPPGLRAEVVVVDDGSDDGSVDVLVATVVDDRLRVRRLARNSGKGAALREGFGSARGSLVGFIDGDGDIDPSIIAALVGALDGEAWCAVASKAAPGATISMSRTRGILSWAYRLIVRLLFGLDVGDTQCGAKLFRRVALGEVLLRSEERRFAFDLEALAIGARLHLGAVREVPPVLHRRGRSNVGLGAVVTMLGDTFRVWSRTASTPVIPAPAASAAPRGIRRAATLTAA